MRCYPTYTADPCMSRWQVAALAVLTLALVACWLPFGALSQAGRIMPR